MTESDTLQIHVDLKTSLLVAHSNDVASVHLIVYSDCFCHLSCSTDIYSFVGFFFFSIHL